MNYSTESIDSHSNLDSSNAQKRFSIPLMTKNMNPIERYVSSYKISLERAQALSQHRKQRSLFESSGSRLIYGGRLTPDIQAVTL